MKTAQWLSAEARKVVAETVKAIESGTAAEIVVTVRARSDAYRQVDVVFGMALATAMLLAYVYIPVAFLDDLAAPAVLLSFAAGVLLSSAIDPLKRLLVTKQARRRAVRLATRAAFVDQGIASTCARTGILVYVSVFEREIEVLPDIGVDVTQMGAAWTETVAALEACARGGATPAELMRALRKLGDPLARAMPRRAGDTNELPDEVVA